MDLSIITDLEAERDQLRDDLAAAKAERDEAVKLLDRLCEECDITDPYKSTPYDNAVAFLARLEVKP
jgi:hypothetical protein